jgi:NitT/TauT family transport system substrate-binding protein
VVDGGELWKDLRQYTFQTAYASNVAIAQNRDGLVRTLAAYGKLYRFLQGPDSRNDFFTARRQAQQPFDANAAALLWEFIQQQRPYAEDLIVSAERIDYLQNFNLSLGTQHRILPYAAVADMSLARDAARLLQSER